jgi:lipopolysaccharide transport system ATP-binding protein
MSEPAIRLRGVGKMYKTFPSRAHRLIETMGFSRLLPFYRPRHGEFWALRGIDLHLDRGHRVGIIGRNGAGKTTLLRLLTGNVAPTEGDLEVHGRVHALLEAGGGFHPEFTGRENVRISLTYQGLEGAQIEAALADIAEFTELEEFLDQPYGTYSAGMQARLSFAAATAIGLPSILIIDEMLGAGDAYFLSKCAERMQRLVETGATVLLVSHALEQITRICDETIWLERGRIVQRGPTLEVVKAYQQFVRVLEDRRLKGRNRQVRAGGKPGDLLRLRLTLRGQRASCDIREVSLARGQHIEERLGVGEAQDVLNAHGSFVMLDDSDWSPPRRVESGMTRTLAVPLSNGATTARNEARGAVAFQLLGTDPSAEYAIEVVYRATDDADVSAEADRGGALLGKWPLPGGGSSWVRRHLPIGVLGGAEAPLAAAPGLSGERRWPGEGSLSIENVRFVGDHREQTIFPPGAAMRMEVDFRARRAGSLDLIPTAVLYRRDGLLVARYIGERTKIELAEDQVRRAILDLAEIPFGNGYYVVTVGLYQKLDLLNLEPPVVYDLVDRSYEFAVSGVAPLLDGVVVGDGRWTVE